MAFMVVPALAAALLGGMTSFGVAVVAGLSLGVAEALVAFYGTQSWFPQYGKGETAIPYPGVFQGLVLVVILLTLMLRGRALPTRGEPSRLRLPKSVTPKHSVPRTMVALGLGIVAMLTLPSAWRLGLINSAIGAMIALSVVVLTGFVAQVSVAQLSIAGVAAFVMAKLAADWGLAFPLGPILGVLVGAVFSLICAVPALRIRGVNLAIVTLAIVEFVQSFVFQLATKGGAQNGVNVGAPRLFGLKFGPLDPTKFRVIGDPRAGLLPNPFFGVFCLIILALVVLMTYRIRRSRMGLRFLAVRSNESASATSGVRTVRIKLLAFFLSALIAGVAGVVSAYRFGSVTPDYFGDVPALTFFAFAYLGGLGGVSGAVAAGLFAPNGIGSIIGTEWLGIPTEYTILMGGIGLVLTVVLNPDGIGPKTVEQNQALWNKYAAGRFGRSSGAVAGAPALSGAQTATDGTAGLTGSTALQTARSSSGDGG
jgi:branched-chain amino acid transport system permease protein